MNDRLESESAHGPQSDRLWGSAAPGASRLPSWWRPLTPAQGLAHKSVEGFRPTLYQHRRGDFGRLALGNRAKGRV